jgi:hypothetical protein
LNKAGLLIGARDGDRFEISPAIDVVLPLERLQELLKWLQAQKGSSGEQAALETSDAPTGDGTDGASDEGGGDESVEVEEAL